MFKSLQVIFCLVSIFVFSTTHATDRSNDTAVLDVDASGEVDALTDGLLLLRSMFGLSDDALTTGVVSPDCVDCDATLTLFRSPVDVGILLFLCLSFLGQNIGDCCS